jgi:transmembrane sensor
MGIEKPNKNEIDQLLIRCIDGSASAGDYKSAWDWINQDEQNKNYYEQIRDASLAVSVFRPTENIKAEQTWMRLRSMVLGPRNSKRIIPPQLLKIAAIMLLAFLLGGITYHLLFHQPGAGQFSDSYIVEAPRGAKSFITMSDGTKIWLNASSKITYQRNYNQQNRNIYLEGEAYFIVTRNKALPFYVHSSGISIKALGTSFNVKAYPDDKVIETTLVEGMVSIESRGKTGKKEKIVIKPNEKASFYKESESFAVEPGINRNETLKENQKPIIERIEVAKKVDTEIYTSWKDKRWIFKKQKLGDFAVMLERLYDVNIIFSDEELKQYSLTGSFNEENLEQVLQAIQLTVPLDYKIHHHEVVFSLNKKLRDSYEKLLKPYATN